MSPRDHQQAPALSPDDVLGIRRAVEDRLLDYWHDVDRGGARSAPDFYTEDCVYQMCEHRMQGRAPIKAYYDYREARGERLVRHVVTNLRARAQSRDQASLDGVLCVYAADGAPVLPTAPPIMVADIECEFVRGDDGQWRMRLHRIVALFRGGVEVLAPPTAP